MTLVGVALVPAAPVLVAELSGRLRPAMMPRDAARRVIEQLTATSPDLIVVVAEGDNDETFDETAAMHLHRLGGMRRDDYAPGARVLPGPLAIGAALLRDAGWSGRAQYRTLSASTSAGEAEQCGRELAEAGSRVGLLLLGNGSACSTPKAPGSLHPQAEAFNAEFVRAITQGDVSSILAWTAEQFVEQLSDARVPLQVFAGALDTSAHALSLRFAEEFQGVFYACAGWSSQSLRP